MNIMESLDVGKVISAKTDEFYHALFGDLEANTAAEDLEFIRIGISVGAMCYGLALAELERDKYTALLEAIAERSK